MNNPDADARPHDDAMFHAGVRQVIDQLYLVIQDGLPVGMALCDDPCGHTSCAVIRAAADAHKRRKLDAFRDRLDDQVVADLEDAAEWGK